MAQQAKAFAANPAGLSSNPYSDYSPELSSKLYTTASHIQSLPLLFPFFPSSSPPPLQYELRDQQASKGDYCQTSQSEFDSQPHMVEEEN